MTAMAGGVRIAVTSTPALASSVDSGSAIMVRSGAQKYTVMNHQNSLSRARPLKLAYFDRHFRTASSKPIGHSCEQGSINLAPKCTNSVKHWLKREINLR